MEKVISFHFQDVVQATTVSTQIQLVVNVKSAPLGLTMTGT